MEAVLQSINMRSDFVNLPVEMQNKIRKEFNEYKKGSSSAIKEESFTKELMEKYISTYLDEINKKLYTLRKFLSMSKK